MKINELSFLFTTDKINETRDFYVKYFSAKIIIDTGSYLILSLQNDLYSLHFMTLNSHFNKYAKFTKVSESAGIVYNICVEDVYKEYNFLQKKGLSIFMPLEKQPFGDEGFLIKDPNGITLFIYSELSKN